MEKALDMPSNVMIYKQNWDYYCKAPALLEKLKLEQPIMHHLLHHFRQNFWHLVEQQMIAEDTSRREGFVSATSSTVSATPSTVSTTPSTVSTTPSTMSATSSTGSATLETDRPGSLQTGQSFDAQFHEDSSIMAGLEQSSNYNKEQVNMYESTSVIPDRSTPLIVSRPLLAAGFLVKVEPSNPQEGQTSTVEEEDLGVHSGGVENSDRIDNCNDRKHSEQFLEMKAKEEQNALVASEVNLKLKLSCINGIWQIVTNKPAKKKRIVLKIKLCKGRFPMILKATHKRKQKKGKKLKQKTTVSINSCGVVPLTLKDQMTGESVFFEKHPNSELSMQHLALIEGKEGLDLLKEYLIGLGRERRELIEEGLEVDYGDGEVAIVNFEEESLVGVADQKFTAMINGDGGNPCMCAVKKDKWWDRNQILAGFPISFDISSANAIYDDFDKKPNGKLRTKVGDIETRHGQVNKPVFEDWGWSKISPCHSKIHLLEQCLNVADHLRAGMLSCSLDASINSSFIIFRMYG